MGASYDVNVKAKFTKENELKVVKEIKDLECFENWKEIQDANNFEELIDALCMFGERNNCSHKKYKTDNGYLVVESCVDAAYGFEFDLIDVQNVFKNYNDIKFNFKVYA